MTLSTTSVACSFHHDAKNDMSFFLMYDWCDDEYLQSDLTSKVDSGAANGVD